MKHFANFGQISDIRLSREEIEENNRVVRGAGLLGASLAGYGLYKTFQNNVEFDPSQFDDYQSPFTIPQSLESTRIFPVSPLPLSEDVGNGFLAQAGATASVGGGLTYLVTQQLRRQEAEKRKREAMRQQG